MMNRMLAVVAVAVLCGTLVGTSAHAAPPVRKGRPDRMHGRKMSKPEMDKEAKEKELEAKHKKDMEEKAKLEKLKHEKDLKNHKGMEKKEPRVRGHERPKGIPFERGPKGNVRGRRGPMTRGPEKVDPKLKAAQEAREKHLKETAEARNACAKACKKGDRVCIMECGRKFHP
ncbi:MAG: hypothetical protein KGL53_15590 [Elusimicrobia bacterium]|nr:hypothetical protein [Elusimicrobiota bacterium]